MDYPSTLPVQRRPSARVVRSFTTASDLVLPVADSRPARVSILRSAPVQPPLDLLSFGACCRIGNSFLSPPPPVLVRDFAPYFWAAPGVLPILLSVIELPCE